MKLLQSHQPHIKYVHGQLESCYNRFVCSQAIDYNRATIISKRVFFYFFFNEKNNVKMLQ